MRRAALLLFAATTPFLASTARADEDAPRTETIVVTASALSQDASEIVQGVSVLSGAELTAHSFTGLGETLEFLPGVSSTFFGAGASRPIIRGLGEDRIRVLSNGLGGIDAASVSPDHAVTADGLEAQTIEVLRGPAALVFGGNAIGGVVNVVDQRIPTTVPEKGWGVDGSFGLSSVDDGRFITGAAVASFGNLVVRIAGYDRDTDDYEIPGFALSSRLRDIAEDAGLEPSLERDRLFNSYSRSSSGTIGASWLADWGLAGLSARVLDNTYGLPNGPPIFDVDGDLEAVAEEPAEAKFIDMKQTRIDGRLQIDQDIGFLDQILFTAGTSNYRHIEVEPEGEIGTRITNRGYEARVQATTRSLGNWTTVFGATGLRTDFESEGEEAFIPPTVTTEYGAFGVTRWRDGAWGAEFGGRLDQKRLKTEDARRNFTLGSVSGSVFYKPVEPAFLSLTVGRTERAPTEQELFADGPHAATQAFEIGNAAFRKEVATSIEGTARWNDDRFSAELNLWHIAFDGFITFVPTGDVEDDLPVYEAVQRDAMFTGAELTGSARVTTVGPFAWSVDGSYDIVRAKFDRGGNVPRIPPQSLRLGTELESAALTARAEVEFASDQNRTAFLELPTDEYTLVHASLTWRPFEDRDRLAVVLDGQNLTDEEVRVASSYLKDVLPRPGRSVRLVVKTAF